MVNNITNISNYTYKLIRKQIKDGVNAGETIDQISKRVQNVYKFNKARATMIARTETASCVNRTQDVRYRKSGAKFKRWINTGGEGSRHTHNSNASQGKIPYDQPFQNGQMFPNDGTGGPSENVNCRCTWVVEFD